MIFKRHNKNKHYYFQQRKEFDKELFLKPFYFYP